MNKQRKIEVMVKSFNNLSKLPKALIKYGLYIFLTIFIIGSVMILLNNTVFPYSHYMDLVSKAIFTTSFSLAAEAVIGGLIMDIVFRR
jgi:hypothetical protein